LQECMPAFEYEFVEPATVNVHDNLKNRRGYLDIGRLQRDTNFAPRFELRTGLLNYISNFP
jgi:hypothetical protein